jgi:phosphoribosylanthranilate isomerase
MVRVKICGNRSIDEILMAIQAGADAVGLIVGALHYTEDSLNPETANEILNRIPPFVNSVLVTHLLKAEDVLEVFQNVSTNTIQLQGNIEEREIRILKEMLINVKFIKTVHVQDERAIKIAESIAPLVDAIHLDSINGERIGGTGITHDWSISRRIVSRVNKPVILAGGLSPKNIEEAIAAVSPFAVDANSGLEYENGDKDPIKVRDFIRIAKRISHEDGGSNGRNAGYSEEKIRFTS